MKTLRALLLTTLSAVTLTSILSLPAGAATTKACRDAYGNVSPSSPSSVSDKTPVSGFEIYSDHVSENRPPAANVWRMLDGISWLQLRAVRDYLADRKVVKAYDEQVNQLHLAQIAAVNSVMPSKIEREGIRQLAASVISKIKASRSVTEITQLRADYPKQATELRTQLIREETQLNILRQKSEYLITGLVKTAPVRLRYELNEWKLATSRITATMRVADDIDAVTQQLAERIHTKISEFLKTEAERRTKELRITLNAPGSEADIIAAFSEMAKRTKTSEDLAKIDRNKLVSKLRQNPEVAQFIYRELQTLRRGLPRVSDQAGLTLRMKTNIDAALSLVDTGSSDQVMKLRALRASIQKLGNPRVYKGLVGDDLLPERHISIEAREKLIRLSLDVPLMAHNVVQAGIGLEMPLLPQAPAGRANALTRATYVQDLASHTIKIAELRAAQARRSNARRAVLAYFASSSPASFKGSSEQIRERWNAASRRMTSAMSDAERRALEDERLKLRDRNGADTDSQDTHDMLMWAVTGNPMWVLNRNFATYQLFVDLQTHHSIIHADFNAGAGSGVNTDSLNEFESQRREHAAAIEQTDILNQQRLRDEGIAPPPSPLPDGNLNDNAILGNELLAPVNTQDLVNESAPDLNFSPRETGSEYVKSDDRTPPPEPERYVAPERAPDPAPDTYSAPADTYSAPADTSSPTDY